MKKTGKDKKKKAALLMLVVAAIAVIFALYIKIEYFDKVDSVICIYDEENKESAIYINAKLIDKVEGKASLHNNMDNSSYYITTDVAVYLMENKKISEIAKNMTLGAYANNSNEAILKDKDGKIYLYKNEELILLTEESVSVVAISGDGNTYSYSTENCAYYGTKPENEKAVDGVVISHISNDGRYMYATKHTSKDEFKLSVIYQNGESRLIEEKATSIIGLNADGTELMYTSADGTFVCVEGNKVSKITEKLVVNIYYSDNQKSWCGDFWSIDTLKECLCEVMETDGTATPTTICKISNKYVAEELVTECYGFIGVNSSMNRIFYIGKDSDLYRMDNKLGAEAELLAEDVELVRISPNGNDVYFTRLGDENITILYHIEKGIKEKQLAYVYDFFDVVVYDDCCYIEAEDIHYVKDDKVEKIEGLDNLEGFFIDYIAQKVYGFDEENVYEIEGKNKKTLEGKFGNITSYDYVY